MGGLSGVFIVNGKSYSFTLYSVMIVSRGTVA